MKYIDEFLEYLEVINSSGKDRIEELADMLEIIKALAKLENSSLEEVIEVSNEKVKKSRKTKKHFFKLSRIFEIFLQTSLVRKEYSKNFSILFSKNLGCTSQPLCILNYIKVAGNVNLILYRFLEISLHSH